MLNSGLEQEYRDHPAFTTFLINSLVYRFLSIFLNIPIEINSILNSDNIDEIFQFYFYTSRTINFFFNLILILIFNKVLKKLEVSKDHRFFICLIFILSLGYLSSFFFIRSENLSLLFLFLSINAALTKNRELVLNFFIAGIFFALAMLSKIQIIFLALYLIYLIPYVNENNNYKITDNIFFKKYLKLSFFLGILFFLTFQIYIQEFPRFQNNKYLDLIFFLFSFTIFLIYFFFSGNFKKNLILLSSMLNGFVFLIIFLIFLDRINLIQINDFIFLRITNPMHYMTEFTGKLANGVVNVDYILKNIFQVLSFYRFNLIELVIIIFLIFFNFRKKNYLFVIFFIFIINALVMNFRYIEVYHLFYTFIYLILFVETIKKIDSKLSFFFTQIVLVVFFINSLNFFILRDDNFLNDILNRENNMLKICNQFQFNISPKTYESVEYLKYWHTKIDDTEIKKICSEIN